MSYTVVSFHAHPDDEVLLTGGTLAKVAAAGHRVVLVVATSGERGLAATADPGELGLRRMDELDAAAGILGVRRVVYLGYPDSGMANEFQGFAAMDIEVVAARLAVILTEEAADVLTTYDERGGYGHPDHIQVHRAGQRAAELAGTPVVLQATVDRAALTRVARLLQHLRLLPDSVGLKALRNSYTPRSAITHRVDVRSQLAVKRQAIAAHVSQTEGSESQRTLSIFLKLPRPLFRLACRSEWFVETGRTPSARPVGDPFRSLRVDRRTAPPRSASTDRRHARFRRLSHDAQSGRIE